MVNLGSVYIDGFDISAGIRPGCPLSPLLFVLVIDLVLRRIQRLLPTAVIKAFADDIALVVDNVGIALGVLQDIFRELELVAGLGLDKPKCLLIPLWVADHRAVSMAIARNFPFWGGFSVNSHGTYLGVELGPGSDDHYWRKAITKYIDRSKQWSQLGLGLQYVTRAYCTL